MFFKYIHFENFLKFKFRHSGWDQTDSVERMRCTSVCTLAHCEPGLCESAHILAAVNRKWLECLCLSFITLFFCLQTAAAVYNAILPAWMTGHAWYFSHVWVFKPLLHFWKLLDKTKVGHQWISCSNTSISKWQVLSLARWACSY